MTDGLRIPGMLEALRTEGGNSVRNKKGADADEHKRRRKLAELNLSKDGRLEIGVPPPLVLNVAPFPPYPAFTGSQIAMTDRLAFAKDLRTVALAYPRDGAWWLEIWSAATAGFYLLGTRTNLLEIIALAVRATRAKVVHIESMKGLPLNLVHGLENAGHRTMLSIHDFVFFCRRPHLIEQPYKEFCHYSTEALRCTVCLRDIDPERRTTQDDYRRRAAESLHDASLLIFPSVFLQRQYEALFPQRHPAQREVVVAPATARGSEHLRGGGDGHPKIAFVGGVYEHRGALLIPAIMERLKASLPKATGFVYGGGEGDLFKQVRKAKGIKVQGYYHQGTLPELLARDRISVAVLPSIAPEGYAVVVDECLSAGVPVVAFDHGAVGERLGFWRVGERVSPDLGAEGLADAAVESLRRSARVPDNVVRTLPQVDRVARKYLEIYKAQRARAR
jgi:glycosyltransferase involved in cell wall biosynthesis